MGHLRHQCQRRKAKTLTTNPAHDDTPSWSRDGKWIYFSSDRSDDSQVWKMPAVGGETTQVTRQGGSLAFESFDGQWLYYGKANGLWRMPRNGGEETRVLESVDNWVFVIAKEGIYFVPKPDPLGRHAIQFFDFETKKIRSIASIETPASDLSLSPDGRWILYPQNDQQGSDLMLVENFR